MSGNSTPTHEIGEAEEGETERRSASKGEGKDWEVLCDTRR